MKLCTGVFFLKAKQKKTNLVPNILPNIILEATVLVLKISTGNILLQMYELHLSMFPFSHKITPFL